MIVILSKLRVESKVTKSIYIIYMYVFMYLMYTDMQIHASKI